MASLSFMKYFNNLTFPITSGCHIWCPHCEEHSSYGWWDEGLNRCHKCSDMLTIECPECKQFLCGHCAEEIKVVFPWAGA